jgi:hypothetical protein
VKRLAYVILTALLIFYGWYVGKTNANLWWQANGKPKGFKHFLIVRPQWDVPAGKPCTVNVGNQQVLTIMDDGHVEQNQTGGHAENCTFQWVTTEVWK